ncbi:MAG: hypothetical protein H6755_06385 [Candidatus Omnitrophica bacterium]|nr:hypothetical protein [Candidatus Omnitrophota bacterium]
MYYFYDPDPIELKSYQSFTDDFQIDLTECVQKLKPIKFWLYLLRLLLHKWTFNKFYKGDLNLVVEKMSYYVKSEMEDEEEDANEFSKELKILKHGKDLYEIVVGIIMKDKLAPKEQGGIMTEKVIIRKKDCYELWLNVD